VNKYEITVNGTQFVVEVGDVTTSPVQVVVNGVPKTVTFGAAAAAPMAPVAAAAPAPQPEAAPVPPGAVSGEVVKAPMPGKVLSVTVSVGDSIANGDTVCTVEAMKMEMPIASTSAGTVKAIHVAVGANVAFDDALVTIG